MESKPINDILVSQGRIMERLETQAGDIEELKEDVKVLERSQNEASIVLGRLKDLPEQIDEMKRFIYKVGGGILLIVVLLESFVVLLAPNIPAILAS